MRVYPECSPRVLGHIRKEAERRLGKRSGITDDLGGFDEIVVSNWEERASWVDDLCDERLPSINKEV
jgi:hypothetical protein